MLAANLTCPEDRIVDGIARLITKTDLASLTNKQRMPEMLAAEAILDEAWQMLLEAVQKERLEIIKAYAVFGRPASRTALLLTKKEEGWT